MPNPINLGLVGRKFQFSNVVTTPPILACYDGCISKKDAQKNGSILKHLIRHETHSCSYCLGLLLHYSRVRRSMSTSCLVPFLHSDDTNSRQRLTPAGHLNTGAYNALSLTAFASSCSLGKVKTQVSPRLSINIISLEMQVTVVPASPKTGRAVIKTLLNDTKAPTVRGVYRDLSRVPQEFLSHPNFKAVKGDISDAASLDFSGADAVFAITPPRYDDPDMVEYAKNVSENTKTAVRKAGTVKRLVLLSSIGAQCDHGTVSFSCRRHDWVHVLAIADSG